MRHQSPAPCWFWLGGKNRPELRRTEDRKSAAIEQLAKALVRPGLLVESRHPSDPLAQHCAQLPPRRLEQLQRQALPRLVISAGVRRAYPLGKLGSSPPQAIRASVAQIGHYRRQCRSGVQALIDQIPECHM